MIIPQPMSLVQQPEPIDDPDWIYELKHDGFRALAVIEHGQWRFFSRKKHKLTGYQVPEDDEIQEGSLHMKGPYGVNLGTALVGYF